MNSELFSDEELENGFLRKTKERYTVNKKPVIFLKNIMGVFLAHNG